MASIIIQGDVPAGGAMPGKPELKLLPRVRKALLEGASYKMAMNPAKLLFGLGALASAASASNVAAPTPKAIPQLDEAIKLYATGSPIEAKEKMALTLSKTSDSAARLVILSNLLDLCVVTSDLACIQSFAPKEAELAKTAADPRTPAGRAQLDTAALHIAYGIYYGDTKDGYRSALENLIDRHDDTSFNALTHVRKQALAAAIYLELGELDKVEESVNRALSILVTLENPEESRFFLASILVDLIDTIVAVGDVERALGLFTAASDFIARTLPNRTTQFVNFRMLEAKLGEQLGNPVITRSGLDSAIEALKGIKLEPDLRDGLAADALTLRALVCMVQGDVACARKDLDGHPLRQAFEDPARRASNYNDVTYLATRALFTATQGSHDEAAARALHEPLTFGAGLPGSQILEGYRQIGAALAAPEGDERRLALLSAGQTLIAAARALRSANLALNFRLGVADRLAIDLIISQHRPGDQTDPIFELMQLASRRGANFDADVAMALNSAPNERARRILHQSVRIKSRRDRLERRLLGEVVSRSTASTPAGRPWKYDFRMRRVFRSFDTRIAEARSVSDTKDATHSAIGLTGLAEFQRSLRDDESAIFVVPLLGTKMAHLCVTKRVATYSLTDFNAQQSGADVRILQSALTSTHLPNRQLDSQFPAAAAHRLYQALLAPSEACFAESKEIIWLPPLSLVSLPISMLLSQMPASVDDGYDLGRAAWVITKFNITYPGSAAALVASRTAVDRQPPTFDFLGVGDPLLSGTVTEGVNRAAAVTRNARNGDRLLTLEELPETREELESSAALFDRHKILVGEQATERNVRREMLGAYRYLSFATHGLIRNELAGLSEPALVVTPVSVSGTLDDGLLTASEIADINLNADFVALSACNTANYDLSTFSLELPALTSAFAVAGVRSSLATLWPVDSQTSKSVVEGLFGRLHNGKVSTSTALGESLRAHLARSVDKPQAHPRFWAPFVILGDTNNMPASAARQLSLADVQRLTNGGGEALSSYTIPGGTLVRMISEPTDGRHSSSLIFQGAKENRWSHVDRLIGADSDVLMLGKQLFVAGYESTDANKTRAVIERLDGATGRRLDLWRAPIANTLVVGSQVLGKLAYFVTLNVFDRGGSLQTKDLQLWAFEAGNNSPDERLTIKVPATPSGTFHKAFVTPSEVIFVTSGLGQFKPPTALWDDWKIDCASTYVTSISRYDSSTGRLLLSRTFNDLQTGAAYLDNDGELYIGGARGHTCTLDGKGYVGSLSSQLDLFDLYSDAAPSVVKAIEGLPRGRLLIGLNESNRFDILPSPKDFSVDAIAALSRQRDMSSYYTGRVVELNADGSLVAELTLDAGSDLFIQQFDAHSPQRITVAGGVGDEAALFILKRSGR